MTEVQINDIFWTFQGEGAHAGRRALFVRMPKCNLKCSWCDTEFDSSQTWHSDAFNEMATREDARFAVLTGGEPLMNKELPQVIQWLTDLGFYKAVETNGTMPWVPGIDWVTCSPKRDAAYKIHRGLKQHVNEYKYVVDDGFDFKLLSRHNDEESSVQLSLSPEFNTFRENLNRIYSFIAANPRWRISLQTHKWMDIP